MRFNLMVFILLVGSQTFAETEGGWFAPSSCADCESMKTPGLANLGNTVGVLSSAEADKGDTGSGNSTAESGQSSGKTDQ